MDIWTVLRTCARRWYVFVPVLGVSLVVGNSQMQAADPVYSATSTAAIAGPALVPGNLPGEIIEVNPFERLGGSLNTTTDVMVALMDSGPKRAEFFDQGVTLDYEVTTADSVIYFDVMGADAEEVTATAVRLVEILDNEIALLQSKPVDAPESRIRAVALALPTDASADTTGGIRLLAVIGALGLLLAIASALVVEGALRYRERRAASRPLADEPDPATATGPHTVRHAAAHVPTEVDLREALTSSIPVVRSGTHAAGGDADEYLDDEPEYVDDEPVPDVDESAHDPFAPEAVGHAGASGRGA
jgi:hypothetical protein